MGPPQRIAQHAPTLAVLGGYWRLPVPREFTLVHEPSGSFAGLQAADYCTWAVHKLRLHHDERPYAQILSFVRRVVEVGADGEVRAATPRPRAAAAWPRLLTGGD